MRIKNKRSGVVEEVNFAKLNRRTRTMLLTDKHPDLVLLQEPKPVKKESKEIVKKDPIPKEPTQEAKPDMEKTEELTEELVKENVTAEDKEVPLDTKDSPLLSEEETDPTSEKKATAKRGGRKSRASKK